MPKMKTHSGAKKRFKATGSGKLRRHKTSSQHEQVRRRKGRPYRGLAKPQSQRVKRLLPGLGKGTD
jgi:large subunit ribosomal protein L35